MMQRTRHTFLITLVVLCTLFVASQVLAETVYVQAKSAAIRSGKTSLSKVVASVGYAESLELLQKDGNWYRVRTGKGHTGWIYANKVTAKKPSTQQSHLAALGRDFRKTQSSSVTATAGVRGLDEFSTDYANRAGISRRHRSAVDRMTNYRISDREVESFLKSGRLGEYAE